MSGWNWSIDGWIILVGLLSACSCALLGNYLVLRKLSLMGDAISHAVLPGLAIAFILSGSRASFPMFLGAVVVGALTALLTQVITEHGKVEHGAAMGVVFSVLFAVGLVLIRQATDHVDLDPGCVLYGNIVQIPLDAIGESVPPAVWNLGIVLVLNVLFVSLFYKELRISAFDPDLATTLGINASVMHYALMIMVAVTTVANFEAVGSILVIAMLIVPGAAAHLLSDRMGAMILISAAIAASSAIFGHVLATFGPAWFGVETTANTAAMIAVTAGGFFLAAVLFAPQHGVIARLYHRCALAMQIARQDVLGLLYRSREWRGEGAGSLFRGDVLAAIGDSWLTRMALRSLTRRGEVVQQGGDQGNIRLLLSDAGYREAATLIGSHRLWEAYLAKHFHLAPDHLHAPAERMEHFITPELQEELRAQLTDPALDPHGKPIPARKG